MTMSMDSWQKTIHAWAVQKGWWEEKRNFGEMIALMHSELSESLEAWRIPSMLPVQVDEHGKPEGWASELADVVIRIMDTLEEAGFSLEALIEQKQAYNQSRPYRHGGKRA